MSSIFWTAFQIKVTALSAIRLCRWSVRVGPALRSSHLESILMRKDKSSGRKSKGGGVRCPPSS